MERIVIEVSKTTAEKWRAATAPKRKKLVTLLAKALNDQKQPIEKREGVASPNQEASLSESSLAKEWLSPEDNRWDDLLK